MNADGTGQHRFDPLAEPGQAGVPGTSWGGMPVVSPDGAWVAYWHTFDDRPQRISVARSDGTGPVIQTGPDLDGIARWVWSPDSTAILMTPLDDSGQPIHHYLLDPTGGPWKLAPWNGSSDPDWQRLAP